MPWRPLSSTNLEAFNYDAEMKVLHVRFRRGGRLYSFREVPVAVVEGLSKAESPGKYFASKIKNQYRPFW